jgi:hypothetical protein
LLHFTPYATMLTMQKGAAPTTRSTDGTLTATILANAGANPTAAADAGSGEAGVLLRVHIPIPLPAATTFGRYFLARCCGSSLVARDEEWTHYARRPLFAAGPPLAAAQGESLWDLWLPAAAGDPGYDYLRRCAAGSTLNLIGPLGRQFDLLPHQRALVVLTDSTRLVLTLPLIHSVLDQGGRVAVIRHVPPQPTGERASVAGAWQLPLAVEVHHTTTRIDLERRLSDLVRWGDRLVATVDRRGRISASDPQFTPADLAHLIRARRFRVEPGFAQLLVETDLVCGYGACLTCVVPTTGGGLTRACLHGPVLPLETVAR